MARPARRTRRIALVACACGVAVACGDSDVTTDTTVPATAPPQSTATPTVATLPATPAPTSTTPPPTSATTTVAPTAPVTSTAAPADNPFTADSVEVSSPYFEQPFAMVRSAAAGDLVVYDGGSAQGALAVRCVVVARTGATTWSEWCAEQQQAGSFIVIDGIDPWQVDVGAELGDVTLTQQPFDWELPAAGCTEPVVSIAAAAELGPSTVGGLRCAGSEALLTYSATWLQTGRPDGGLGLLSFGAEGWNLLDTGTYLDCATVDDGIDRCALFGVDDELRSGPPIPPASVLPSQIDAVGVRDETVAVAAMAAGAADVGGIVDAIVAALTPSESEARPTVTVADDAGWGYAVLAMEIPLLDDSTASSNYVVWIRPGSDGGAAEVTHAFAWYRCARGVADGDLCV